MPNLDLAALRDVRMFIFCNLVKPNRHGVRSEQLREVADLVAGADTAMLADEAYAVLVYHVRESTSAVAAAYRVDQRSRSACHARGIAHGSRAGRIDAGGLSGTRGSLRRTVAGNSRCEVWMPGGPFYAFAHYEDDVPSAEVARRLWPRA